MMLFTEQQWGDILVLLWAWTLILGSYLVCKSLRESFK